MVNGIECWTNKKFTDMYTIMPAKQTHLSIPSFLPEDKTEPAFDGSLKGVYMKSCEAHKVIPASYFMRHMYDLDLEMRHHGLGHDGVKPLAIALVVSDKMYIVFYIQSFYFIHVRLQEDKLYKVGSKQDSSKGRVRLWLYCSVLKYSMCFSRVTPPSHIWIFPTTG